MELNHHLLILNINHITLNVTTVLHRWMKEL